MEKTNIIFFLAAILLILVCCNNPNKRPAYLDSPSNGTINISVDEGFRPVMEEQIAMYEASFPGTKIIAHYKPEAECLKDLFRDSSNRMVVVTRGLDEKEQNYFKDSLQYVPAYNVVALDAVVLLVNAGSNDTLFTLNRLKEQLQGKINRGQEIVFDGLSATSTVRFIKDSILKGGSFDTSVVRAAKNSEAVIDYIATHPKAVGLVGINWIGNPEDSAQVHNLQRVKMAYVQCTICPDTPYVKPMPESIDTKRYPLVRGLYYIVKENNTLGLGTGFMSFLKYERGQLIFRRAYLVPVMQFGIRNVLINEKIPEN